MRTAVLTVALLAALAGCGSSGHAEVVTPATTSTPTPTPSASPSGGPSKGKIGFLAAADLPQGDRYGTWKAGEQSPGLGDPPYFCLREALPADHTTVALYSSDKDAEAREFLVGSADAALEAEVRDAVSGCAARYKAKYPQDKASGKDYPGTPDVNGVFFAPKDSEYTMQLFAIKRTGDALAVLVLAQGGQAAEAPVEAFRASAAKL